MKLSASQIKRQDFVDNAIMDLLKEINPTNKILNWDIESIAIVRDAIENVFVTNKICSAKEFYA